MAKYLIDSTDIEIEEVSGTENLKFNLAPGNSAEQMVGDLSNLTTTNKSNLVNAINEVNTNLTNLNTYSTTETIVGKWIDNKPIYRKVINFGALPNATTKSVALGIANIDQVVNLNCIATSGTIIRTLPTGSPSGDEYNIDFYITGSNIEINTGIDRSAYSAYVIIEYTKN